MTQGTDLDAILHGSPLTPEEAWWDVQADDVEGYDLIKDEALFQLVGVPFLGYRVTFRDGTQRKGVEYRDDYASVELRVAPHTVILRDITRIISRRKTMNVSDKAMAQAGEQLVVNDGSTGLYRQITKYLVIKELITLPEGPEDGEKGECIYDLPRSQWLTGGDKDGFKVALRCARGLRFSEYPSPVNPSETARTWYIA